jgi:hypothetical protein
MTTTRDEACCAGTSMYGDCICPPEPREQELDLETLPDPDGAGPSPGPEGWEAYWSKDRTDA